MATEDPLSPEQEMVHSIRWDWVASLYDAYVTATFDLPFWLQHATAAKGAVLELMCGTGRISVPLAEAGVSLTCVDASAGMLARPLMVLLGGHGGKCVARASRRCTRISRRGRGNCNRREYL